MVSPEFFTDDLNMIRQSYGARQGSSRYHMAADANLDGRITAFDLAMARRNERDSRPPSAPPAGCEAAAEDLASTTGLGGIYDRVPAVVPQEGFDPNAPMQFFESQIGWVQPLPCAEGTQGNVWTAPGESGMQAAIVVDWFFREAGYGNDLVIYTVDDDQGKIGSLSPGDAGYATAAATRQVGVLDALDCASVTNPNHQNDVPAASPLLLTLDPDTKFTFYLVQGSYEGVQPKNYKWFPFSSANVDSYQHFQQVSEADSEEDWYDDWNQALSGYKVEDLSNNTADPPEGYPNPAGFDNDADFNDVVFTVSAVWANATAYRPLHANGNYAPFARTAVEWQDEASVTLGPGIRINGDDDNDNDTADRSEQGPVNGENDVIEVVLQRDPTNRDFRLRRSSNKVKVWTSRTKGTEITFPNDNGLETNDLPFGANKEELTVWVEWVDPNHGTADLTMKETIHDTSMDMLKFHTFQSIVIALGGENQDPVEDAEEGTFLIATNLYGQGYDVHMYDEDNVDENGAGAVYDEVVSAVQDREVDEVAIFGYSHRGGSTHDLADRLEDNQEEIGTFTIPFTAYVDAVTQGGITQENRRPPLSAYHANYYQQGSLGDGWLDGGPIDPPGANFEIDVEEEPEGDPWDPDATHFTIDDLQEVRDDIEERLENEVTR